MPDYRPTVGEIMAARPDQPTMSMRLQNYGQVDFAMFGDEM